MANFVEFSGAAALNQNLAGKMADALRRAIADRGQERRSNFSGSCLARSSTGVA
jgi:hypothetical protein